MSCEFLCEVGVIEMPVEEEDERGVGEAGWVDIYMMDCHTRAEERTTRRPKIKKSRVGLPLEARE